MPNEDKRADGSLPEPPVYWRTMQFLIETSEGVSSPLLPRVVWVFFPAVPNSTFGCPLCKTVYRVLDADAKEIHEIQNLPFPKLSATKYFAVCEHMGHLIE
jgi:hypothetical protein